MFAPLLRQGLVDLICVSSDNIGVKGANIRVASCLRRMLSQQSKRLFELVENLLDLSRLEADSLRIS